MFIITPDDTLIEIDQTRFFPDAFTQENYDLSWSKTSHPVANGFTKSDAIFKNPSRLTLSGCVAGIALNKQGADPFDGAEDRTVAACNFIEAMGNARDCVTINTGEGKIYRNMVLVNAPIRFESGGVMFFDLSFEELELFNISETFDAALGEVANIGEVSTESGEPETIPEYTPVPDTTERLDYFVENPSAFSQCQNDCGVASVFCLDACYANVYSQAGL